MGEVATAPTVNDATNNSTHPSCDATSNISPVSETQRKASAGGAAGTAAGRGAKPAMQIYRPPGLRSDAKPATTTTSSNNDKSATNNPPTSVEKDNGSGTSNARQSQQKPPSQQPPSAGRKQHTNGVSNDTNAKGVQRKSSDKQGARNGRRESEEVNNNRSPPPSLLARTISPPPHLATNGKTFTPSNGATQQSAVNCANSTSTGCTSVSSAGGGGGGGGEQRTRAASTLSEGSQVSSGLGSDVSPTKESATNKTSTPVKQKTPPIMKKKDEKRRQLTPQEMLHAGVSLRALSIVHCTDDLEKLINSEFSDEVAGASVGQALVMHAVETSMNSSRSVAKTALLLKESSCFPGLHRGFILGLSTFFADRETMRSDRFRSWLALVNLCSDLFANVGDNEQGELVSLVFDAYRFLLRAPILDEVKIEELECLISSLLSIGYELERECPDKLAQLKDLIRDAFIEVSEPWARKMILLMLELSASDWKLPQEANEYYFHQTSN